MRTHRLLIGVLLAAVLCIASLAAGKEPRARGNDMSGQREMHMWNCPSAVPGATTNVVELDDGVELTITARDEAVRQEIWRRAQNQGESAWKLERGAIEHTGLGTGSGRYGFCPGILEGTTVDADLLVNGAKLTIRADRPAQIELLKRTTKNRLESLRKRRTPRA